jgi:antirestriction protein
VSEQIPPAVPDPTGAESHLAAAETIDPHAPRIWVGSLSDYNNGILHGVWIDAAQTEADLHHDIQAMLSTSPWAARSGEPAEEWSIFDSDNFGPCRIDENENLSRVSAVANGIAAHGAAFAAWANIVDDDDGLATFQEHYLGHYDDVHDYVVLSVEESGYDDLLDEVIPADLRPYVDIDTLAMARDLELSGEIARVAATVCGVWLFDGRLSS